MMIFPTFLSVRGESVAGLRGAGAVMLCLVLSGAGAVMSGAPAAAQAAADRPAMVQPEGQSEPAAPKGTDAQSPPAVGPSPAGASFRPGLLDALGRFVKNSISGVDSGIKDARSTLGSIGDTAGDAAKGAVDAAQDAASTLSVLPSTRVVSGREKCGVAANGAPDCYAAATTICRTKGYKTGKSVDTQSAQKCPAAVLLSGRVPPPGTCAVETYVTRAVCN